MSFLQSKLSQTPKGFTVSVGYVEVGYAASLDRFVPLACTLPFKDRNRAHKQAFSLRSALLAQMDHDAQASGARDWRDMQNSQAAREGFL